MVDQVDVSKTGFNHLEGLVHGLELTIARLLHNGLIAFGFKAPVIKALFASAEKGSS